MRRQARSTHCEPHKLHVHLAIFVLLILSAAATFTDLRSGRIPHRLTAPVLVGGVLFALWRYGALDGGMFAIGGVLATAVVPFIMHRLKAMGGGDVMLLGAIGAWLGPVQGIEVEFVAFVFAAFYGMARMAWEGTLLRSLGTAAGIGLGPLVPKRFRPTPTPSLMTTLRFAPAVLAGVLVVLLPPLILPR